MTGKRRVIGHITKDENTKTVEAITEALRWCVKAFNKEGEYFCRAGVLMARVRLQAKGFDTSALDLILNGRKKRRSR